MTIIGVLIIVLLLAAVVISGLAMYRFVVVPGRRTTKYAMSRAFAPEDIARHQPYSSFLGLQSSGIDGQRVLGTLVLTADKLWFHNPGNDGPLLDIPITAVESAQLVREHLGTVTGRPLLLVQFSGPNGPDSAGFHLPYPDEWQIAINNIRRG